MLVKSNYVNSFAQLKLFGDSLISKNEYQF